MAFKVDPSTYEEKGGATRPNVRDGRKLMWLAGLHFAESQNKNVTINCCFVVVEDPDGGRDVGGLVWDTFTLTQAAAWRLQQVSVALQKKGQWDAENKDEAWEVLSSRPVYAQVHTEAKTRSNGQPGSVAKVDRYEVFAGDATDAHEEIVKAAEDWHREWKKKAAQGARRGGGGGGGYGRGDGAPPPGDDDIPF